MSSNLELSGWNIQHINTPWKWLCAFGEDGFWVIKLPVELRAMVFKEILNEQVWNGKPVPLIIALRGHKNMYQEALDVFFRHPSNIFRLWLSNICKSMHMSQSAAAGIRNLEISVSSLRPRLFQEVFKNGANFTTVSLKFSFTKTALEATLISWILTLLHLSTSLHALQINYPRTFGFPERPEFYTDFIPTYRYAEENLLTLPERPANMIEYINAGFGVIAYHTVDRFSGDGWNVFKNDHFESTWTWKAPKGEVLVWEEFVDDEE